MKLLNEYLEHALTFERMAAEESNPEVKAQFEQQAKAYRRLAAQRAEKYGLPAPSAATRRGTPGLVQRMHRRTLGGQAGILGQSDGCLQANLDYPIEYQQALAVGEQMRILRDRMDVLHGFRCGHGCTSRALTGASYGAPSSNARFVRRAHMACASEAH